jgi:predicted transcriptional regulator of viral defense system
MSKVTTKEEQVLDLARKAKILRVQDLIEKKVHPEHLRRLYQRGLLVRMGRGVYMLPNASISAHFSLAEVAKKVPRGIICLLSALRFHEIGTQSPSEVWIALDRKAARPRVDTPRLRVMRFSQATFSAGVETHKIDGVIVRLYCPAKTVADCFKYRNKIGLDVAIEALRECRRSRKCKIDDLSKYAKICRVANVMRPYLESIT